MTHSISLSFDRGNLIAVYIEGEIESVNTSSRAVGEICETTVDIVLAQCSPAVTDSEEGWNEEELAP